MLSLTVHQILRAPITLTLSLSFTATPFSPSCRVGPVLVGTAVLQAVEESIDELPALEGILLFPWAGCNWFLLWLATVTVA